MANGGTAACSEAKLGRIMGDNLPHQTALQTIVTLAKVSPVTASEPHYTTAFVGYEKKEITEYSHSFQNTGSYISHMYPCFHYK